MPKKNMSSEERKAWGAKMKAAREAAEIKRRANRLTVPEKVNHPQHPLPGTSPKMDGEDVQGLLRRIEELAKEVQFLKTPSEAATGNAPSGISVSSGGLVGTFEKFVIDPAYYPDPRDRLAKEAKLSRFAFGQNYELNFNITTTQYQTLDGVNTREPKFTLELVRRMLDEDTGEDTGKRYVVCRAIFHEDPQAAITIAREQGLGIDTGNEKAFLDEMRYLRMRDWLFEAFYPPKPTTMSQKRETVIGNKLVEVYEINSEQSEVIPFSQLTKKL